MKDYIKLILLLPFFLNGQTRGKELNTVVASMRALNNYSFHAVYKLYLDGNKSRVFQASSAYIKRKEGAIFYKYSGGSEFISNERTTIYLDKHSREIQVRYKQNLQNRDGADLLLEEARHLDSLLLLSETIGAIARIKNTITYELSIKPGETLKTVSVCIDTEKKLPLKTHYSYTEAIPIRELKNTRHKVVFDVSFEALRMGDIHDPNLFDEERYISSLNGNIKPATHYSGYTLTILN